MSYVSSSSLPPYPPATYHSTTTRSSSLSSPPTPCVSSSPTPYLSSIIPTILLLFLLLLLRLILPREADNSVVTACTYHANACCDRGVRFPAVLVCFIFRDPVFFAVEMRLEPDKVSFFSFSVFSFSSSFSFITSSFLFYKLTSSFFFFPFSFSLPSSASSSIYFFSPSSYVP